MIGIRNGRVSDERTEQVTWQDIVDAGGNGKREDNGLYTWEAPAEMLDWTVGHTFDYADQSAPIFVDKGKPLVSDHLNGNRVNMACSSCNARTIIVRKPQAVVVEHKKFCPWLRGNGANPTQRVK